MSELSPLKTYQEIADDIFRDWLEQMRSDSALVRALGSGRKVDVTLFAHQRRVSRQPDYAVKGDGGKG